MSEYICGAIDVGYGNLKSAIPLSLNTHQNEIITPSIVEIAQDDIHAEGITAMRDTLRVMVDGTEYEVGEAASRIGRMGTVQVLHDDYISTPTYKALLYTGLLQMRSPVIDLLVTGLPVNQIKSRSAALKELAMGEHQITASDHITVKDVVVLPQPMGGLIHHAHKTSTFQSLKSQTVLVIDPGCFTFDWLLMDRMNPNLARSGSSSASMGRTIELVAEMLENRIGRKPTTHRIDAAIRTGKKSITMGSDDVEFTAELKQALAQTARVSMSALRNAVGDTQDINQIVMVGGAAELFMPAVKNEFSGYRIELCSCATKAIVLGYRRYGEMLLASKTRKAG